jgi:hypothetical protein
MNNYSNELEAEFESWVHQLRSLGQGNHGNAQQLAVVGQIVGKLLRPTKNKDINTTKPPIPNVSYTNSQRIKDHRTHDQLAVNINKAPPIGRTKAVEFEMAVLISEVGVIYDKIKESEGVESILSEVLLETLEEESYDAIKSQKWSDIFGNLKIASKINPVKNLVRNAARKLHYGRPEIYQPIGVEVHHWIPFKYAHFFKEYTVEQLNRLTIPLDSLTHALVGAAIDRSVGGKPTREKIEKVLGKLSASDWRTSQIRLNPAYFKSVSDVKYLPSPKLTLNKNIGVIMDIKKFKISFGLPRELEFEATNLF